MGCAEKIELALRPGRRHQGNGMGKTEVGETESDLPQSSTEYRLSAIDTGDLYSIVWNEHGEYTQDRSRQVMVATS